MKKESNVFFPGINGLRFFAALAVIITHVELIKGFYGFKHYWNNPIIFNLGGLGVYFFFVLSGFLITFLLLKEKSKFNGIKIGAFYMRRILRIWPLYYLIIGLGFFILPHINGLELSNLEAEFKNHFGTNLILYCLILPNVAFSLYTAVPHIGQVWSIGIEEQFYIIWPWIISKSKNLLVSLFGVIILLFVIKLFVLYSGNYFHDQPMYIFIKNLVAMSKFECMAIGGLGAYFLFYEQNKILSLIFNHWILNGSLLLTAVLTYYTPEGLQDGIHIVFSGLFLVIIMNVAVNKRVLITLENPLFDYLGKISYGIYMYHLMIIPIVLLMYQRSNLQLGELNFNILVYTLSVLLTILISGLSYSFFENKFIRIKSKYALIKSGKKEEGSTE